MEDFKKLTKSDWIKILKPLGIDLKEVLEFRQNIRKFIKKWYVGAYEVRIMPFSDYNDENHYKNFTFEVSDENNKVIEPPNWDDDADKYDKYYDEVSQFRGNDCGESEEFSQITLRINEEDDLPELFKRINQ